MKLGYTLAMNFAPIFLLNRATFRVYDFLMRWYVGGTQWFVEKGTKMFRVLEQICAVYVTLRHMFEPLYGDYTITGRIISFPFRLVRVVASSFFYICIFFVLFALYLAWLAIPVLILVKIFT